MQKQLTAQTTSQREELFVQLYRQLFPSVARYVANKGGSAEEAKDVFQDSVIIYYEKIVAGGTECDNEHAYLMGIAKHVWLRKFNGKREEPLDKNQHTELPDADEEQLLTGKLMHYLETTGQKCMDLLKAFYYDQLPLDAVARLFGYSGVRSATVQKYKCLEKVRDTVKQKSLHYEDFVE